MNSALQGLGPVAGGIAGGAAAVAAAVAATVGAAIRKDNEVLAIANRVSIGARAPGAQGVDARLLAHEFQSVAIDHPGLDSKDVAEAAQQYVGRTGDLEGFRKNASTYATVARASGGSIQDISSAGAELATKFGITRPEDMKAAMAVLHEQGKRGALEIQDAARIYPKMAAAAQRFGLTGSSGLATLGGLSQIAKSSSGSPEEAATAVESMFKQLIAKSGALKGQGVDVFEKGSHGTKTRDVQDVLVDTISKNHGSLPALQKVFDTEGLRAISPLVSTFNDAANGTGGSEAEKTAAGVKALRAALSAAIDTTGGFSEVQKDAAQAATERGAELTAAWESLTQEVGDSGPVQGALDLFTNGVKGLTGYLEEKGLLKSTDIEQGDKPTARGLEATNKKISALKDRKGKTGITGVEQEELAGLESNKALIEAGLSPHERALAGLPPINGGPTATQYHAGPGPTALATPGGFRGGANSNVAPDQGVTQAAFAGIAAAAKEAAEELKKIKATGQPSIVPSG